MNRGGGGYRSIRGGVENNNTDNKEGCGDDTVGTPRRAKTAGGVMEAGRVRTYRTGKLVDSGEVDEPKIKEARVRCTLEAADAYSDDAIEEGSHGAENEEGGRIAGWRGNRPLIPLEWNSERGDTRPTEWRKTLEGIARE